MPVYLDGVETTAAVSSAPPAEHDLAGDEHAVDTLSDLNAKVSDATLIDTTDSRLSDARTPTTHDLAGSEHGVDTLANLNAKVSDATLIDTTDSRLSDARTPTAHDFAGTEHNADTLSDLNVKISDYSIGGPVAAQASTPLSVSASDSGKFFTNEGSAAQIVFNLPTAAAGLSYSFFAQDANGIQVVAASGDTIRVGTSVSGAAGNIVSTAVGDLVTLKAINATEWVATEVSGTWTVT